MLLLYNFGIKLYYLLIFAASSFNKKARLWVDGRRNVQYRQLQQSAWFHFASLGEFEQGRPVLEAFKKVYPAHQIVITFFSPSGYEIRKNTPLADAVYYLPLDTPRNARQFIDAIQPDIAIFTKYEYWYHFFNELHQRNIPLLLISGIFKPQQVFFKWYGSLHRTMLTYVSHFFVQDTFSKQLLENLNIKAVSISGDTRFDRVWANSGQPKALPIIHTFKNKQKLFIGGSTWPADEQLIASLMSLCPDWKFIIAPHELSEEKITTLLKLLPHEKTIRFSAINEQMPLANYQVLVIDNIGMLSSIYQYGEIAFIGGGFGAGIHNTLEAAAFGLPVLFGPNYKRFKEACDLIDLRAGFCIKNEDELKQVTSVLIEDNQLYAEASISARGYVQENTGATDIIMAYIGQLTPR